MTIFSAESPSDHEQIVFISDASPGLRAIIAIHDTTLGRARGGCRTHADAAEPDATPMQLAAMHLAQERLATGRQRQGLAA